jgi:hypothetical protein
MELNVLDRSLSRKVGVRMGDEGRAWCLRGPDGDTAANSSDRALDYCRYSEVVRVGEVLRVLVVRTMLMSVSKHFVSMTKANGVFRVVAPMENPRSRDILRRPTMSRVSPIPPRVLRALYLH